MTYLPLAIQMNYFFRISRKSMFMAYNMHSDMFIQILNYIVLCHKYLNSWRRNSWSISFCMMASYNIINVAWLTTSRLLRHRLYRCVYVECRTLEFVVLENSDNSIYFIHYYATFSNNNCVEIIRTHREI